MGKTSGNPQTVIQNPSPSPDPWGKWTLITTVVMSLVTIGVLLGTLTAKIAVLETKIDYLSNVPDKIDSLNEKIHQTQMGLVQIAAKEGIMLTFDGVDIQSQQPGDKDRKPQK